MSPGATLFERLVVTSRMGMVAPFALHRMLRRARVDPPESVTPAQLAAALPYIEEALRVYLRPEEVPGVLEEMRRVGEAPPAQR